MRATLARLRPLHSRADDGVETVRDSTSAADELLTVIT